MKRGGLSQQIAKARGFCIRCADTRELHGHHIVPVAQGGTDTANNVDVLCRHCHREWHRVESNWGYQDFIRSVPGDYLARLPAMINGRGVTIAEAQQAWLIFTLGRYVAHLAERDPASLRTLGDHSPTLLALGLEAATANFRRRR